MQHIETVTVGSGGAASITFSAIPDTFTDLYLVVSGRSASTSSGGYDFGVTVNGSSTGYTMRRLYGTGDGTVGSDTHSTTLWNVAFAVTPSVWTANTFGNGSAYFPNYRSSVAKSVSFDGVSEQNAARAIQSISAGLWSGTDPITSIVISGQGNNIVEYSSASLYGILAGSDGIVSVS